MPHAQRIIGLTGGVGMGKSTVSRYLAATYPVPILDADQYARDAVAVGSPLLSRLVEHYGATILSPDGSLDRCQLGDVVFTNPAERQWLEQQIHPYVRDRFAQAQRELRAAPVLVYDIPLLFEAQLTMLVTEIWVVYCSPDQQQQRILARDRLTVEQIQARIASQWPIAAKIALADVVLDNSGNTAALIKQIDAAWATPPPPRPRPPNG